MYRIRFEIGEFRRGEDPAWLGGQLQILLSALTDMNEAYLRRYPETPKLFESGVRYADEKIETWSTIPAVLERGVGDCDDLAPWRAAEIRVEHGIKAWPLVTHSVEKTGEAVYHVQVQSEYGIEDPSAALGMKVPSWSPFSSLSLSEPGSVWSGTRLRVAGRRAGPWRTVTGIRGS